MKIQFDVNDAAGRESFIVTGVGLALRSLAPDTPGRFGALTARQMVEHLLWTFEISTGHTTVTCPMPEDWRIKARSFLHSNRPSPQGFENPLLRDGLPGLRFESISAATKALDVEARRFLELAVSSPDSRHVHPVFGPATVEEWSRTHYKHCVHHLLQFGLIEIAADESDGKNA